MVIYKHNLAEKLFGFAYSKEFLRENTDLCGFVDDPNLSLDIDLAVEFHKALRSDPIAAEKVTNLLILSSSYIDVSTAEFYTDKMKTYPVFDRHIDRINDLFDSLPDIPKKDPNSLPDDEREREEIGKYINEQLTTFPKVSGIAPTTPEGIPFPTPEEILYERVSLATGYTPQQLSDIAFNSNFNNALKNALEDCLNSPCNLFSETSDSIASLANQASMMNSTTMPTWGELKNNFFNAIGGVPDTIFKKVPMSIKNSIIELGQIGQQAMEQSTEMFFAKDPDKKKKIIQKALAGQSLNTDSTGYKYLPDLDSYLNVTKMSTKILKKAADDLGGCFNKFQQAARYEPYNPEHNKSFTSKDPINNKRGDDSFSMNTTGKTNNDYKARTTTSMSSCDYAEPASAAGAKTNVQGGDLARGRRSKASEDPEVQRELRAIAAKLGVSVEALEAVIQLESGWSTTTGTGQYYGLAQMGPKSLDYSKVGLTWEQYKNGSEVDQLRAWGYYLEVSPSMNILRSNSYIQNASVAEQAAAIQGVQFSPYGTSWAKALVNGDPSVRATTTKQARALGDTSHTDMTKYYSGN